MCIHVIFHVSLFEPYNESQIPKRIFPPPPPVGIDQEIEYEIEEILNSRIRHGHLEYYIYWKDYNINKRTWECLSNVTIAPKKIQEFHQRYPNKPKCVR